MVQYTDSLGQSFAALSDPTRREVLERLSRSDASISDLARHFAMTLTGMNKHIGVLEQAGFVATAKVGRVRTCRLGQRRLEAEAAWIEVYCQRWEARFTALNSVIEQSKEKDEGHG